MAEKTEKATPKKLRDARKKGQVAKSQDFPSAFTFIISITGALLLATNIYQITATYMRSKFIAVRNPGNLQSTAGGLMGEAIQVIANSSIPLMIVVAIIGVVVNFLIVGPLFSMEAMKPDIKRLNPVTNIKNLFKLKTFIELLKSILKISGALILIYSVIYNSLGEIIGTCGLPLMASAMVFADFLQKVVLRVGIFFIALAVFDLVFQKKNFAKEMKMEKFEVRQEFKDTEGDPHVKSRRRQTAQEIAYQEGPSATRRAKAVISNPTHIAVAIEYDSENEPAPKIVTMGQEGVAEQIIKVALDYNIPVMRNIELAQTLYYEGKSGEYIPEKTYPAVAEVLKWIAKLEQAEKEELAMEIFNK